MQRFLVMFQCMNAKRGGEGGKNQIKYYGRSRKVVDFNPRLPCSPPSHLHLQNQTLFVSSEMFLYKRSEWRQGFLQSTGNQCWRILISSLYPSSPFDTIPHNKSSLEQTWSETESPGKLDLSVRRAAVSILYRHRSFFSTFLMIIGEQKYDIMYLKAKSLSPTFSSQQNCGTTNCLFLFLF